MEEVQTLLCENPIHGERIQHHMVHFKQLNHFKMTFVFSNRYNAIYSIQSCPTCIGRNASSIHKLLVQIAMYK